MDNLRLKDSEKKIIEKLSRKINLIRLNANKPIMRESEIMHYIIALAVDTLEISENGDMYLNKDI